MHLIHHPMLVSDIDDALAIICDAFLYTNPQERRNLTRLWREIIVQESGFAAVIEDRDNPSDERLLYVGIAVCLTDEAAALVKSGETPYVSRHILDLWRQGQSPFLNPEQIARSNSTTGLTLLVLHTGFLPAALHPADGRGLRDHIESYSYLGMGGNNYKEVLFAVYGDFCYAWSLGAGMLLKTDYARHFQSQGTLPPPEHYPRLVGYERGEAQDGSNVRQTSLTGQPRFYFTAPERKMLLFALQGMTDEEIADMLSLSVPTVRKRWQAIYDCVQDIDPPRLAGPSAALSSHGQKKRRLLDYLRCHLEEMRPYARPVK